MAEGIDAPGSAHASEDNTSCPGIGEKEVASEGFSVSSLDDLIGMATHQQFVMEKGNEPVSIQNCDDVTTPSSMNIDNGKIPTPNVCKVVLQDICKATVKKPGGQVVQGYPCNACQQILTTYRGLEVHRRENPQCSHYTSVCNVCTRSWASNNIRRGTNAFNLFRLSNLQIRVCQRGSLLLTVTTRCRLAWNHTTITSRNMI